MAKWHSVERNPMLISASLASEQCLTERGEDITDHHYDLTEPLHGFVHPLSVCVQVSVTWCPVLLLQDSYSCGQHIWSLAYRGNEQSKWVCGAKQLGVLHTHMVLYMPPQAQSRRHIMIQEWLSWLPTCDSPAQHNLDKPGILEQCEQLGKLSAREINFWLKAHPTAIDTSPVSFLNSGLFLFLYTDNETRMRYVTDGTNKGAPSYSP